MIRILLLIGSGSFLGGISRYLTSRFIQQQVLSVFPFGTFVVNILGCFLIGLFYGISQRFVDFNPEARMFLTVGFCGGFTTFSTFSNESLAMMHDGNILYVALYAGGSVVLGILATYIGTLIVNYL